MNKEKYHSLSLLERADWVVSKGGGDDKENKKRLGESVARLLQGHHFSLSHALLAALPVKEVITTKSLSF